MLFQTGFLCCGYSPADYKGYSYTFVCSNGNTGRLLKQAFNFS